MTARELQATELALKPQGDLLAQLNVLEEARQSQDRQRRLLADADAETARLCRSEGKRAKLEVRIKVVETAGRHRRKELLEEAARRRRPRRRAWCRPPRRSGGWRVRPRRAVGARGRAA